MVGFAAIRAEAFYRLGAIASVEPGLLPERPLQYFKQGIELIAKEPVSELTWQLMYALASEYHQRGQQQRAREFLMKTNAVLEYFLSHFSTPELRMQYLNIDNKSRVLAAIRSVIR